MQMAFGSARWRWEFLGTTWSKESDANPPEEDTNLSVGNNNEICCLSAQLIRHLITPQQHHNSQPMLLLENTQCTGTTFFPYAEKIRYKSRRLLCDVKFLIVLANYPNLANAHLHISTSNPGHSFLRNWCSAALIIMIFQSNKSMSPFYVNF